MKTRIISGLVMAPLLVLVWLGGYWLMAAAFAVGLMGVRELYKGFEAQGIRPSKEIAYVAICILYLLNILWPENHELAMLWVVICAMASMVYGFDVNGRTSEDSLATLFGLIYVVFFSYHIVWIDQSSHKIMIWLVFLTAFGTDIMAYFTGMAFGKHKLCPNLSPKKSVEGAVGGVLGSVALCVLFGWLLGYGRMLMSFAVIGLVGSIAAQLGDLSASALKRRMGIKDYGNLIPGHGGIMDRFDSVLFTAPLIYYTAALLL